VTPIPTLRHYRSKRIALLAAVIAIVATPLALFAHAKLLRSSPASGATLAVAPTSISLWFSEKPELKFSSVQLSDSAGTAIALGALTATDSMGVTAPITSPIVPGKYSIAWKTAAADGHATSGKVTFAISAAAVPPGASIVITPGHARKPAGGSNAVITPDADVPMSPVMRWVELVAVLTLIGLVMFRLAVVPGAKWTGEALTDVDDRLRRLANGTLVLQLVSTLTRAFVQADLIPNQTSRMTAFKVVVQDTQWGHGWAVGAVGSVLVLIGLALSRRRMTKGWALAGVGLIGVALGETLTGHAASSPRVALAVAADVSHILAAGGWLGGLAALMLAGLPTVRRLAHKSSADYGSRLLQSFHGTAVECVTLIVLSAVISSWLRLGSFDALWKTPYGNMLLRKIFFVLVALALGWYHSRRIVPATFSDDVVARFKRSAAAELIIGLVIVGFTALLITMQTPR
jgi:copper transport protein